MNYSSPVGRRQELGVVLALAVAILILWHVPFLGMLFYPFRLFGTFVHEISHGLAAVFTGGTIRRFAVNPDLSGVTWSAGGVSWIVASAGYIGSAVFGGLLVLLRARGVASRRMLFWMGIALGVLCLLFVRNLFGIATGFGLAAGLVLAGQRLNLRWANGLLLVLAVQLILDGMDSLFSLVRLSAASPALTDAAIMARSTGIPALFWAVIWTVISVMILGATLREAYRR